MGNDKDDTNVEDFDEWSAQIMMLVERFPRLFHGRPPRCWSDLPKGWTVLADRLFADLDVMLDDATAASFQVDQIKEKFARLRVYWKLGEEDTLVLDIHGQGGPQRVEMKPAKPTVLFEQIRARVRQACEEASSTCQRCGNGGAAIGGSGWLETLCDSCRKPAELAKKPPTTR